MATWVEVGTVPPQYSIPANAASDSFSLSTLSSLNWEESQSVASHSNIEQGDSWGLGTLVGKWEEAARIGTLVVVERDKRQYYWHL